MMSRLTLVMLALAALFGAARVARAQVEPYERWYVTQMQGQKMGWMQETLEVTEEGLLTRSVMSLRLARGAGAIDVVLESEFLESRAGEPIRMIARSNIGSSTSSTLYTFGASEVRIEERSAGQEIRRSAPLPEGEWLTPVEADRYVRARMEAGARTIVVRTVDALTGLTPTTMTMSVGEQTTVQAMGKSVPAIPMSVELNTMPGVAQTEYVDLEGNLVRAITDLGGLEVTILASDKETAMAEFDAPEMMASTLIKADRRLDDHMFARRATFVLRTEESGMPDLVEGGAQRTEKIDADSTRVVVNLDDPVDVEPGEVDPREYLEATSAVNWKDQLVGDLAQKAVEGVPDDPRVRAFKMVQFVSEYIDDKSLDVGFANASEVCRTREGDCSEHAVLLAALLRAKNIPSRVVSGVVYIPEFLEQESVFGYHMWTQGLIRNRHGVDEWVDLDAAYPLSALRIALSTSALSDDDGLNSMVTVGRVLGNLSVEVESVE